MIPILEKDRAPSRIEFSEGPWCEQLLGSLRGRLAPAGGNRVSCRLDERGLRGEEPITELRVQPVVSGPRRKQNEKEDEERWGELGADPLQKNGDSDRHPEHHSQS